MYPIYDEKERKEKKKLVIIAGLNSRAGYLIYFFVCFGSADDGLMMIRRAVSLFFFRGRDTQFEMEARALQ